MAISLDNGKACVIALLLNKKGGKIAFLKDDLFKLKHDMDPENLPKFDDIDIEPVKIDKNWFGYKFTQDNLYVSIHASTLNKLVSWFPFIDKLMKELESYIPRIEKFLDEFKKYPKTGQTSEDLREKFLYTIKNDEIIEYEIICIHFNFLLETEL